MHYPKFTYMLKFFCFYFEFYKHDLLSSLCIITFLSPCFHYVPLDPAFDSIANQDISGTLVFLSFICIRACSLLT